MERCKLIGIALIVCASSWTGFRAAAEVRKSVRQLRALRVSLEQMRCEIACRLTPLRKLCGNLAQSESAELSRFYRLLEERLSAGEDIPEAAKAAQKSCRLRFPQEVQHSLDELFRSFGQSDYLGQLRLLELAQSQVASSLERLAAEQKSRCRCYELLGVCTGFALAIVVA